MVVSDASVVISSGLVVSWVSSVVVNTVLAIPIGGCNSVLSAFKNQLHCQILFSWRTRFDCCRVRRCWLSWGVLFGCLGIDCCYFIGDWLANEENVGRPGLVEPNSVGEQVVDINETPSLTVGRFSCVPVGVSQGLVCRPFPAVVWEFARNPVVVVTQFCETSRLIFVWNFVRWNARCDSKPLKVNDLFVFLDYFEPGVDLMWLLIIWSSSLLSRLNKVIPPTLQNWSASNQVTRYGQVNCPS